MPLVRVLLKSVLHGNWPVHEELAVHRLDGCVGRLKIVKADKAKALGDACTATTRIHVMVQHQVHKANN
jgi:hypothetical protein